MLPWRGSRRLRPQRVAAKTEGNGFWRLGAADAGDARNSQTKRS
jgi:hypothetical protein